MDEKKLGLNDILALERTHLAAERTLMGWIRTSFSMMTFGFTIYKVLQEVGRMEGASAPRLEGPRNLGFVLAALGTVSLLIACWQHWRYVVRLRRRGAEGPFDLTLTVAALVVMLGFLILAGLVLRTGPFG